MEGLPPGVIQLQGAQGPPPPPPPAPPAPGGAGGQIRMHPQGPPPNAPVGQTPAGSHLGRGGMPPVPPPAPPAPPAVGRDGLYGVSPQNHGMRQPSGRHPSPRFNSAPVELHQRRKVEIFDIREELVTDADARECLSSYFVVRIEKAHTTNEVDREGYPMIPTWEKAAHIWQYDIPKGEATRKVRDLDKATSSVMDKKHDLSTPVQRQLEFAQESLEKAEDDSRYCYVLAQFDFKAERTDVSPESIMKYIEYPKKSKHRSSSRGKDRHKSKSKSKSKGKRKSKYESKKYFVEPHKSKQKRKRQIVSVTAYFKRMPKVRENCLDMLREQQGEWEMRREVAQSARQMPPAPFSANDQHRQLPMGQHMVPPPGQHPHLPPPLGQHVHAPIGQHGSLPPPGNHLTMPPNQHIPPPPGHKQMLPPHQRQENPQHLPPDMHIPPPPGHQLPPPAHVMGQGQQVQGNQHPHQQQVKNKGDGAVNKNEKHQVEVSGKKPKVYPVSPRSSQNSLSDDDGWSDSDTGLSTLPSSVGSDKPRGSRRSRSRSGDRPEYFGVPRRDHDRAGGRPKGVTLSPPRRGQGEPLPLYPARNTKWADDYYDQSSPRKPVVNNAPPRIIQGGVPRVSPAHPRGELYADDVDLMEDRFGRTLRLEQDFRDISPFGSRLEDRFRRHDRPRILADDDEWWRQARGRRTAREADDSMAEREREFERARQYSPRRRQRYYPAARY